MERRQRALGERIGRNDLEDCAPACTMIEGVLDDDDHHRLHLPSSFLQPVADCRGNLGGRCRPIAAGSLEQVEELRKQKNISLQQHVIPGARDQTPSYPESADGLTLIGGPSIGKPLAPLAERAVR